MLKNNEILILAIHNVMTDILNIYVNAIVIVNK